jgi:PIN domain nuclease of toxin-antitoxin system
MAPSRPDPADRFIMATARVFELTLVTADEALLDRGLCPLLPAR